MSEQENDQTAPDSTQTQVAVDETESAPLAAGLFNELFGGGLDGADEHIDAAIDADDQAKEGETAAAADEFIEIKFGPDKHRVPKSQEALYRSLEKAFTTKQSEADKAAEKSRREGEERQRLETQLNLMSAQLAQLTGGKASTGAGSDGTGVVSPAGRQASPVDEILRVAKEIDEESRFEGKFTKFAEQLARFAAGAAMTVKRDVDAKYGETAEMARLQEDLPVMVAQQIAIDSEDPDLADIVATIDPREMADHILSEKRRAKRDGRRFDANEIYHKRLVSIAKQSQVSGEHINGTPSKGGGAGNGHSPATSRSGGASSGGIRGQSSRIPQALRPSSQKGWSAEAYEAEMRKAWG